MYLAYDKFAGQSPQRQNWSRPEESQARNMVSQGKGLINVGRAEVGSSERFPIPCTSWVFGYDVN